MKKRFHRARVVLIFVLFCTMSSVKAGPIGDILVIHPYLYPIGQATETYIVTQEDVITYGGGSRLCDFTLSSFHDSFAHYYCTIEINGNCIGSYTFGHCKTGDHDFVRNFSAAAGDHITISVYLVLEVADSQQFISDSRQLDLNSQTFSSWGDGVVLSYSNF